MISTSSFFDFFGGSGVGSSSWFVSFGLDVLVFGTEADTPGIEARGSEAGVNTAQHVGDEDMVHVKAIGTHNLVSL